MNLSFKIGDTALNSTEAKALLSVAGEDTKIVVDIGDYISPSLVDAKSLFNLSVVSKNATLAGLAARFAIEGIDFKGTGKKKRKAITRISELKSNETFNTPGEVVEQLMLIRSLKALGAAMILEGLNFNDNRTLRQVATSSVNQMSLRKDVNSDFACFRGFKKDFEGFYRAVTKDDTNDRTDCYHASPTYTAMRDGAALLKQWGLVEMHQTTEFGSNEKELDGNSKLLRRLVYRLTLTDLGKETVAQWADIQDFIVKRWTIRSGHSTTKAA
jgi:hypothetical protein